MATVVSGTTGGLSHRGGEPAGRRRAGRGLPLLLILVLVIGGTAYLRARGDQESALRAGARVVSPANVTIREAAAGFRYGKASARVSVVVFEDFLCPACRRFEETNREVFEDYVEQGKIRIVYQPVAILAARTTTNYSVRAAAAAAAVLDTAPHRYLSFHRALLAAQPPEGGAGLTDASIVRIAARAGVPPAPIAAALATRKFEAWVTSGTRSFSRKYTFTPTVVIDGRELADISSAELVVALEEALHG